MEEDNKYIALLERVVILLTVTVAVIGMLFLMYAL